MSADRIETAPRDGTFIRVWAFDDGVVEGPFEMQWDENATNALVGSHKGLWITRDRGFTWDESRGAGPTHWEHIH